MTLLQLFYEFFQIGLFALGGGPATIPFLMNLAGKYDWFTVEQLTDMIAISESTPGPLGVNMATFAGYHAAGIPGAVVSTLSLVFPSIVVILIIAKFLSGFSQNEGVKAFFYGIRPAVTGLIAVAVLGIFQIAFFVQGGEEWVWNLPAIVIAVLAFVLMNLRPLKKIHPIAWIAAGAVVGIVFRLG